MEPSTATANTTAEHGEWTNRIVDYEPAVPADQLTAHPLNARRHPARQRDALRESLGRVGWVDVVKVNTRTGNVVDGHARIEEAITKGSTVPVLYIDIDPDEERFVLATLDPISAMAEFDAEVLTDLMDGITVESEALAEMLGKLTDAELDTLDPTGGPEPTPDDDESYSGDGSLLDRVGSLVDEPVHETATGDVWDLWGRHTLVVASITDGHDLWAPLLEADHLFMPYPGPYLLMANRAETHRFLMVQPDTYIAARILDTAVNCYPDREPPVKR